MIRIAAAFPGTGKTHFSAKFPEVTDADSSLFDKASFPDNYMDYLESAVAYKFCVLVSSHGIVRDALVENGFDFFLVFPAKECKEEYIQRYRQRGSPQGFIDLLEANWEDWIAECEAQENCTKIQLAPGEYLEDVLFYDVDHFIECMTFK